MADAADAIRKARAGVLLSDVYPVGSVVGTRQARRRRREPKAPASDLESAASAAADTARLQPRRPTVPPLSEAAGCNAIIPERFGREGAPVRRPRAQRTWDSLHQSVDRGLGTPSSGARPAAERSPSRAPPT